MKRSNKKIYLSIIVKALCLISAIYGCFTITEGLRTFTKFTTLSNVGIGLAMILFIYLDLKELKDKKDYRNLKHYKYKFAMSVSIYITFLIYALILAPTSPLGFFGAYANHHFGSFSHHLASPLFAILDYFISDENFIPQYGMSIYAVGIPLTYVFVIFLISLTGFRWDYGMSGPYNFLNYGGQAGWFGFDLSLMSKSELGIGVAYIVVVLSLLFYLIGLMFIYLKRKFN